MRYTKRVFLQDDRWQYEILDNGDRIISQDYHPDEPGFVAMDEATADACADIVIARLEAADAV